MPTNKAYIEVLVSIAAVIDKHMRSPTMLQDDLETASKSSSRMTDKEKLLNAVANLLPRHPKERIALAARTDRTHIFITSSDDTCNLLELRPYLSGLWVILRDVAQFHHAFFLYLRERKRRLDNAGDTESKVVDEKNDERVARFAKEGRDLYGKLGELVYARCRGRMDHEIKRRWKDFQNCLSFLRKASDMETEARSTVIGIADELERHVSAILDGKIIQGPSGRPLGLYTLVAQLYLMQKKAEFKQHVTPLSVQYRNESGFDLCVYLNRVGAINSSLEAACISTKHSDIRNLFSREFTVTVTPPRYQTPASLPTTSAEWTAFLERYADREYIRFLHPEEIVRLLLEAYPPATSPVSAPARCHSELELFAYLYDEGIAQEMAKPPDGGEKEDLYIATSHRPCFACIWYFAVVRWDLRKYRLPELDTRYDFNRSTFPWQIPEGKLESERNVKYLFKGDLTGRLSSRFTEYGIAVPVLKNHIRTTTFKSAYYDHTCELCSSSEHQ
ncbi:hypothetical protein NLJ89_g1182 [Agrocybe chaxingu]|uniref:Uncharacterized protein n=1 Tax=Agrocybe chaxingu TaxID=84603 RepID=A0A9W8N0K5_9AGAR|nr:hypothetical protein NLJ89_g1182 [Agrocybe chaxingu]